MVAARTFQTESGSGERLFRHCLFCSRAFRPAEACSQLPPGRKLAFDPDRMRLWSICDGCRRWNLIPIEERVDAIWRLERMVRDEAELITASHNISLHRAGDITIVRIGHASSLDQALWRYGRQLRARNASYNSRGTRFSTRALGAVAYIGDSMRLLDLDIKWGPDAFADVLRWKQFGLDAWHGRSRCPHCNSVLHTLRFDMSWWLYPRIEEDGTLVVGVPCTRCDPWTPRNVFDIRGPEAESLLRRVLAYQHIAGAQEQQVREASSLIRDAGALIREAGGARELVRDSAAGRQSLWRLGEVRTLALEMSLNQNAEQKLLDSRLRTIEQSWRREEEIAAIIDDELTGIPMLRTE
jgi:hypothetical protein